MLASKLFRVICVFRGCFEQTETEATEKNQSPMACNMSRRSEAQLEDAPDFPIAGPVLCDRVRHED